MDATFVLGEHTLESLGQRSDAAEAVSVLVELLDQARQQGEVLRWGEIFAVPVDRHEDLADFLYGKASHLDRDLRLHLGVALDRLAVWDDSHDSPPEELTDGASTVGLAPSTGLAHENVSGSPWAVLCAPGSSFVSLTTVWPTSSDASRAQSIWFLDRASMLQEFWRDSLDRYNATETDVETAAAFAFPGTSFGRHVWSQTGRFQGNWSEVCPRLLRTLAGLDDGAVAVFETTAQPHERIQRMAASHHVDCSPESPSTHRNRAAMVQREAEFEHGTLTCEWHAKLEPHRNRVHFTVKDSRLYVGIFHEHLIT